jgi:hypothetical protein
MRSSRPGDVANAPPHFRSRIPFFGPKVLEKVLRALAFIRRLPPSPVRDLFSLAFGSVMVNLSNYSYEPSLSSRPAAGKPLRNDAPVTETITAKLQEMLADITALRRESASLSRRPSGRVIAGSFLDARLPGSSPKVDLVVTSPPYLNNYHYLRNTRPQLYWLGLVQQPGELKPLAQQNFGKYWQTVRNLEPVALNFEHPRLEKLLARIRKIRVNRGAYGGPGWANYAASYFNDTEQFCRLLRHWLKPGACAVVVVGNSILQGVEIPVDRILSELAARHGLVTESMQVLQEKRLGSSIVTSSIRLGARTRAGLYESAVVLKRLGRLL